MNGGTLVRFESRREMECLIKYINDEIVSTPPAMNKYAIGLYGSSESGIFEWDGKEQGADAATFDDPTLSFTNWWVLEIVKQDCQAGCQKKTDILLSAFCEFFLVFFLS